ncbi:putative SPX domain-containing protein [Seiridium cardinale]
MFDDLVEGCASSSEWPRNLLHSQYVPSVLQSINTRLRSHKNRLFIDDGGDAHVDVMEILTGKIQYKHITWQNMDQLQTHIDQHLLGKEKDPLVRYIFLTAAHSKAPLSCTLAMFQYICTFHQISPELTELVYTFGCYNTDDFYHTQFFQELQIESTAGRQGIPELSRSSRHSRAAYKLFAIEESDFDNGWTIRQTAVYHSLDLANGRTIWLVVKANDLIRDRIKEENARPGLRTHSAPTKFEESIAAVFKTHLSLLEWSCEGWRWYLSHLEQEARSHLTKVTAAPIPSTEQTLDPIPGLVKALSLPRSDTLSSITSSPQMHGSVFKPERRMNSDNFGGTAGRNGAPSTNPRIGSPQDGNKSVKNAEKSVDTVGDDENRKTQVDQTMKRLNILKDFSLGGHQSLNSVLAKVKQAKTAMSMNVRIVEDLKTHYEDMFEALQLPEETSGACATHHRQFQRRAKTLGRFLESECLRAKTLVEKIRDGIGLASQEPPRALEYNPNVYYSTM